MSVRTLVIIVAVPTAALLAVLLDPRERIPRWDASARRLVPYEAWARSRFYREHPGEKPLNWRLGEKAVEFSQQQPLKPFVLHQNDCSDFVACIVDAALGAEPRIEYQRGKHTFIRRHIWNRRYWRRGMAVQPGDIVSVAHSPWYDPYEGAIWHVGVLGSDGAVRDFTKLKSWRQARYGSHTFEEFIRHSKAPRQVIIWRLKPAYRYLLKPVRSSLLLPLPEE